jgi:hypothetical protein
MCFFHVLLNVRRRVIGKGWVNWLRIATDINQIHYARNVIEVFAAWWARIKVDGIMGDLRQ